MGNPVSPSTGWSYHHGIQYFFIRLECIIKPRNYLRFMEGEHHYEPKVGLYAWSHESSTHPKHHVFNIHLNNTLIYNRARSSMQCLLHRHYLKWTRCVGTHDTKIHNILLTFRCVDRSKICIKYIVLFLGPKPITGEPPLVTYLLEVFRYNRSFSNQMSFCPSAK